MLQQHNIEIDDIRTTRRQLASELRIFMWEFHGCINSCMAFIGTHEWSRICSHCKTPRFYGDSGDGEEGDMNDCIPRAWFRYMPIIPHLRLLYANKDYQKGWGIPTTCAHHHGKKAMVWGTFGRGKKFERSLIEAWKAFKWDFVLMPRIFPGRAHCGPSFFHRRCSTLS